MLRNRPLFRRDDRASCWIMIALIYIYMHVYYVCLSMLYDRSLVHKNPEDLSEVHAG